MTLALTDVRLTYPDGDRRLVALDAVNLRVTGGELVAVTGPSGSGKSSLLAVAGALTRPESGTVRIADTDVTALDQKGRDRLRRERIGFVFQQANLLASLTALDQLLLVAHLSGASRRSAEARARGLLDRVGLGGKADKRPHQLSGGERQRVGIVRALMGNPALLLVDEPTSALDHERGEAVVTLLRDITHEQPLATVMVTHDLQYLHLADRTVAMRDGRVCPPAEFSPRSPAAVRGH
ncbi:ABC transporter ATP-binding protein [Micromonospora sp. DR5-3]|uniref:ABC transporter ATP-binding protein n=1 Tax=unclassified Micromonospora TaxID=2617518 RepID=UPI0011D4184D|nr:MULTISPECIES: ABC transporter ATP-binding protein [unclassified Micromonospora]MCW3816345.1 ABC transporter ATP-binding protein [Micromonospora sp. DR5-3]TYC22777.1 ABC transporter ATP-binding protein [Micromonospora sp. MP36]